MNLPKISLLISVVFATTIALAACRTQTFHVFYECDNNKTIKAVFYQRTLPVPKPGQAPILAGSVDLSLSDGRKLVLPQTISASGIRYADPAESIIFWSKGGSAFIVENNKETYGNCKVCS